MQLRAYYWKDRIHPLLLRFLRRIGYAKSSYFFKKGNFGDIFYEDLVKYFYGQDVKANISKSQGKRLLLIGSIAHKILPHDIACGIGSKFEELPPPTGPCHLVGLRGPLSCEAMRRAGYDTSTIKFLYDPGLLVRFLYPETNVSQSEAKGALFIPHYRERYKSHRLPEGFKKCDPDNTPEEVAQQIKQSEIVYSSSLHGIIFAHAFNRPAIFVRPRTEEPTFKYDDYFASIGMSIPSPTEDIESYDFSRDIAKSPDLDYQLSDFAFPRASELQERGIAT